MNSANDDQPFLIVGLADTPDSRLFIELSSYRSDLAEARHALDLAINGREGESPLAEAAGHLVGLAVVAYCRTDLASSVRGRLTDHVDIPDDLVEVHNRVKAYRNATVAHSQSELAVTYAVGVLESDTLRVRDVTGVTVLVPLPDPAVDELWALIDTMQGRLEEVTETVRVRLMDTLAKMDRFELEAAPRPVVREAWARDFNPKTKRPRHSTGHTVYWNPAEAGTTHD